MARTEATKAMCETLYLLHIQYIPKPAMTVSIRPAPAAIRRVSATYTRKPRYDGTAGMPLLLAYLPTLLHMYIRASQELIDNTPYF